jgi:hypothetical protein
MLEEDSTCDAGPFHSSFDVTPTPLRAGLARMLRA